MANMKLLLLVATIFCGVASVVYSDEVPAAEPAAEQQLDKAVEEQKEPASDEKKDPKANGVTYSYSYETKPEVTTYSNQYVTVSHSHHMTGQVSHSHAVTHHVSHNSGWGRCPSSHPYAYYSGSYCCKYGREKVYRPQGSKCDGSTIQFNSLCCYANGFVRCPNGKCRNYGGRGYPHYWTYSHWSHGGGSGGCYVDIYQHIHYRGIRDRYTNSVSRVRRNDDMSSLRVPGGCCVRIYEHVNYRGRSRTLCGSTGWIGSWWNDKMSSLKVFRRGQPRDEESLNAEVEATADNPDENDPKEAEAVAKAIAEADADDAAKDEAEEEEEVGEEGQDEKADEAEDEADEAVEEEKDEAEEPEEKDEDEE